MLRRKKPTVGEIFTRDVTDLCHGRSSAQDVQKSHGLAMKTFSPSPGCSQTHPGGAAAPVASAFLAFNPGSPCDVKAVTHSATMAHGRASWPSLFLSRSKVFPKTPEHLHRSRALSHLRSTGSEAHTQLRGPGDTRLR